MKKKILIIVGVFFLVFSIVSSANAWWFAGNVTQVKRVSYGVLIKVDNGTTTAEATCNSTYENQLMAVALTAISGGNQVSIQVVGGIIQSIVINN